MNVLIWNAVFAGGSVIVLGGLLLWLAEGIGKGSDRLVRTFGEETYAQTVRALGTVRGEMALETWRSEALRTPRPELPEQHRLRFEHRWRTAIEGPGDNRSHALSEFDELVSSIVAALGYPTDTVEHTEGLVSVDHPSAAHHLRVARKVSERARAERVAPWDVSHALDSYDQAVTELLSGRQTAPDVPFPVAR